MIARDSYSKRKFTSFSPEGQIKALARLLQALEASLDEEEKAGQLRAHILECVGWMESPLPENVWELFDALNQGPDAHRTCQAISRFHSSLGKTFKDSELTIVREDGPREADPAALGRAREMIVILDNLRSVFNVGSIFRSAECLGLGGIWLCGVTATPENPALQKTAMGTAGRVDWRYFPETSAAVRTARESGFALYALETAPNAESVFTSRFELPLALVVGNESLGIAPDILRFCGHHIQLPVQGWKNSLNVGVAFAVCAYQIVFGGTSQTQGSS
jgi:23S rRNA (guanosine2251-2'-O)-methyltransferase